MSSVAFGVWFSATFVGICNHAYGSLIEGSVRMGFGHVTIEPRGFNVAPSLDKKLANAHSLLAEVRAKKGVAAALPRIFGPAMFSTAAGGAPGMIFGIDPGEESQKWNAYLGAVREGRSFTSSSGRGALVGSAMAERLHLKLGSKLIYTAVDAHGEMISETARVEGIFKTGVDDTDASTVLLPIDSLRKILKYSPDEFTMISIYLEDQRASAHVARTLSLIAAGTETLTWRETQAGVANYIELDGGMANVFLFLIALVIGAGVLNTMLMSVLERKRELGVMLAVGTSPAHLFRLIVCEASLLSLLGFVAGTALFVPWMIYMQRVGIDLTRTIGSDMQVSGALYDPILRIALQPHDAVFIVLGLSILVVATAAYPAHRASQLPPLESMR